MKSVSNAIRSSRNTIRHSIFELISMGFIGLIRILRFNSFLQTGHLRFDV